MTNPELLTVAAVVISMANFIVLLLSFRRAGQWKDSDEARRLIERVTANETDINGLKVRMENVATKADVARLTAEITGVERQVVGVEVHAKRIEGGVERIESYLMQGRGPS